MRVLLVEDHEDLAINICDFLEARSMILDHAADGVTGLHLATVHTYDVIVLDLGLPGIDGLTLCRELRNRARKSTPVLMLTARDTLDDKLRGFAEGADDYLVKPFALAELAARVSALSRRGGGGATSLLWVEDLCLDPQTREVRRDGRAISLSRLELRMLRVLMEASPAVVRRADLEAEIWGDEPPDSVTLRSHIHNLRKSVDRGFDEPLIHTIRGVGYRVARLTP